MLGSLGRGVGNARCTANEYELAAEFGADEAGGRFEAQDDGFAQERGEDDWRGHVSKVGGGERWVRSTCLFSQC
jgi:hypothetical protein